eukprot:1194639-Prorocentrum_minimum.AAC.4
MAGVEGLQKGCRGGTCPPSSAAMPVSQARPQVEAAASNRACARTSAPIRPPSTSHSHNRAATPAPSAHT